MISIDKEAGPFGSLAKDASRELVDRICASSTFAKSARLTSFLTYVCDLALKGQSKEINEQRIGEAVFGRPHDYDCSVDSIVRTQASRLRHRLDRYFVEEGVDEPIRIVIPRGRYVPIFEPRSSPQATDLAPASVEPRSSPQATDPVPAPVEPRSSPQATDPAPAPAGPPIIPNENPGATEVRTSGGARFAWTLVAILAIAMLTILLRHGGILGKTQATPTTFHPLWSRLFVPEQRTLIVPGDSSLVIWEGLMNRNIGLAEYIGGGYRIAAPAGATSLQQEAVDIAKRRYTSTVDLEMVQPLSQIAQSGRSKLEVRYARDVRPNDLKMGNVILIGAAEANPWVQLFEANMNFVSYYDRAHDKFSILNRAPQGNEPPQWDLGLGGVFAVVAYLPNLSGNGNTLILEGTSMAGTECAWDFVSDDSQLLPFLKRIRRVDDTLPHFELVLLTDNMGGSAVKSRILAWRTVN